MNPILPRIKATAVAPPEQALVSYWRELFIFILWWFYQSAAAFVLFEFDGEQRQV